MIRRIGMGTSRTAATIAAAGILGALVGTEDASGQDRNGVTVEVGECVDLASEDERFACYEAQVEAVMRNRGTESSTHESERDTDTDAEEASRPIEAAAAPARDVGATNVPPDGAVAENARSGRDNDSRRRRREERKRAAEADEKAPDPGFVTTITAMRETVPDSYLFMLENGQVWRQTQPRPYPLQPGDDVRIYQGGWSDTFRLTSEERRGFIYVERVR